MRWSVLVAVRDGFDPFIFHTDWVESKDLLGLIVRGLRFNRVPYFDISVITEMVRTMMSNATREPFEEIDVCGYHVEIHEKELCNANV